MTSTITSGQWIAVRRFVEQVRLHAHETVVDKSVIQDILDVVDAHGIEMVQNMIQHEKRLIGANNAQKFNIQQDWHDEEDFNRADSHGQRQAVPTTDKQGSDHGLSK
jgi:cysteine synthase